MTNWTEHTELEQEYARKRLATQVVEATPADYPCYSCPRAEGYQCQFAWDPDNIGKSTKDCMEVTESG